MQNVKKAQTAVLAINAVLAIRAVLANSSTRKQQCTAIYANINSARSAVLAQNIACFAQQQACIKLFTALLHAQAS